MNNILKAREDRYNTILDLINRYQLPVVSGKINYPGNNKNTMESLKAFGVLQQLLIARYTQHSIFTETLSGEDGKSLLMVVQLTSLEAKKTALNLETNHPLGRIFDIDVYREDGRSIGRENVGLESRRCFLCNEDARVCMRTKNHSLQQIIDGVNKLIMDICL
ncbi:holo-ACP synthase [Anaerovirgula multivorans]|uniref:citrate lyase holo-[acyl-carrier protein] synthase n=1 Tax=Anaerovirgula multivorans TaxID=312168 RepID=A0A239D9A2_9FIRM|nr:citrate lyase holo-[acyl-carrier protein] synthase [Anaerovirgula multivorans]SNS28877.1 holo-ACP synthase [Anaerovirgula multivorans]